MSSHWMIGSNAILTGQVNDDGTLLESIPLPAKSSTGHPQPAGLRGLSPARGAASGLRAIHRC